jgi:hypothetical protein
MDGRRPRRKPFVSSIAGHPHNSLWSDHQRNPVTNPSGHLAIHKKILELLPMPSHTGRAKPVSPPPVPHRQGTAESIDVNNEHRTVIGGTGRMSPPFDSQQPSASVADPDCSGNWERDASRQCRQRRVCGLTPAVLQHNQMTVTRYPNPAGEIQPCPVRTLHDTL